MRSSHADAEKAHAAELHQHIRQSREFRDVRRPFGKPRIVGARRPRVDHATQMIDHHRHVGKRARRVDRLAELKIQRHDLGREA
jgi:hypothetical protein